MTTIQVIRSLAMTERVVYDPDPAQPAPINDSEPTDWGGARYRYIR